MYSLDMKTPIYTEDQDNFLILNYARLGPTKCAEVLNKTYASIRGRAKKLNLVKCIRYTQEEDLFIKNNAHLGGRFLADKLDRTLKSIQNRAKILGISIGCNRKKWEKYEETFLIQNYSILGPTKCASILNRSISSVERKGDKLDLRKNGFKLWTKEEEKYVQLNYPTRCSNTIAKELNISLASLLNKASNLNIQKINSINKDLEKGYLYIIEFPNLNLFKVGISVNPYNRFACFQHPYILHSLVEGTYKEVELLEKYLLNFIKDYKCNTGILPQGNTETYRF